MNRPASGAPREQVGDDRTGRLGPEPLGGRAAPEIWDVVVIGGGNAALVSALTARHHVRNVLVLERAPQWLRGGNSRHTRNVRCVHAAADAYNTGSYLFEELYGDLCAVGTGPSDEYLAEMTVKASESVPRWMTDHGISWQPPLTGTLHLGRTNRFFLGGGKALMNRYYKTAGEMGITVAYEASAEEFISEGNSVTAVVVDVGGRREQVRAKAIVVAAGGFEANIDWLARYWGEAARNYIIRGPIYNDGTMLQALYNLGAASAGEEKGFHSTAVDARSPRFDGGIATRLDSIPFGVVVNRFAKRFYDEGEELWPKRYAIWGRNIAEQDGQIAYAIWDSKVTGLFLPPMYGPIRADSLPELAGKLGLAEETFCATLGEYNAAVIPGAFDPTLLDDCHTAGLEVPKSHWAQRIDQPPFFGIAMRPGITFTYLGVKVDEDARVRREDGSGFENVFAAGEIMSGNVLSSGYLAGFGLTIGTVWGRIAGSRAAELASS
jgi:tricarballylate dehydrogenase